MTAISFDKTISLVLRDINNIFEEKYKTIINPDQVFDGEVDSDHFIQTSEDSFKLDEEDVSVWEFFYMTIKPVNGKLKNLKMKLFQLVLFSKKQK